MRNFTICLRVPIGEKDDEYRYDFIHLEANSVVRVSNTKAEVDGNIVSFQDYIEDILDSKDFE